MVQVSLFFELIAIGIVAAGRVHAGSVRPHMELSFAPSQRKCSVGNSKPLYYLEFFNPEND